MTPLALVGWGMVGGLGLLVTALHADARRRAVELARGCHELRGPLTAARLGLCLEADGLAPATAERLRAIDAELGRAAIIVEELAGPSAPRAARLDPEAAGDAGEGTVELDRVAGQVLAARMGQAQRAGVSLDGWLADVLVAGDGRRIAQAMANLIDNALTHGRGPVEVVVGTRGDRARVEVSDHGPGLAEPLEEIIRRARRPGRAGRHGHGLVVAAEVAAAHGGWLGTAPSARGARIVLELPLARAAGSAAGD